MWQPPCPTGFMAQNGGIDNHRSPWSAGERDPSSFLHGVTPMYPGMCCQGTGKQLLPRNAVLLGEALGVQGHRRAPGTLTQPVARKHHLPEKSLPPFHTYHIRLLLPQPASLSCGPEQPGISSQSSPLAWSLVAGRSRQHPRLHLDCMGCWPWPYSPLCPSQLQHTAEQQVGDAALPAELRAARDAQGCRQDCGQEALFAPRKCQP